MRINLAYFVLCCAVYLCTSAGRIVFPDDEIVFQTTRSLYERGGFAIEGIPRKTGEPKGQPDGSFGWALGRDGRRYGFFGHGLSVVATPMYALGKLASASAPAPWRHAVRSDHFFVHRRSQSADWTRLVVSLTNCVLTAVAGLVLAAWVRQLGYRRTTSIVLALAFAFATLAWPYTRTFLSEALSTLCLLAAALALERSRNAPTTPSAAAWLLASTAIATSSVHVHLLNIVALPCFFGYAIACNRHLPARAWVGVIAVATVVLAALGLGQWWRYGSVFETGRYGLYSHFDWPFEALAAFVVAPGRSFWLFSPALILALFGAKKLWRTLPGTTWFVVALVLTRTVLVATRSDWWGGWAVGPRYLVPLIPFALLGLAPLVEHGTRRARIMLGGALVGAAVFEAHLARCSIFEWMLKVNASTPPGVRYIERSHWEPAASPIVGFFQLPHDMLSLGALRLAQHGHSAFAWLFALTALIGVIAAGVLVRALLRERTALRRRA